MSREEGQATLEYLLVVVGVLAVVVALGALIRMGADGRLAQRATESASHSLGGQVDGVLLDALMY